MPRRLLLPPLFLLAALFAAALWLTGTSAGLGLLAGLAESASGGRLHLAVADGSRLDRLAIATLRWQTPEIDVSAEDIRVDWSPGALLRGRLRIAELSAARLRVDSTASTPPTPPPTDLRLPLAVDLEHIAIASLAYGDALAASRLSGRFASDGRRHRVDDLRGEIGGVVVTARASLDGVAPLPLQASAEVVGQLDDRPLGLDLKLAGPLARPELAVVAGQGVEGHAEIALTPFAAAIFSSARIALDNIDPAAWQPGAPAARLALRADLAPRGDGVAGRFSLSNGQPGALDRQRLPLVAASGQVDWQGATARLEQLRLSLPGRGELAGRGRWQEGSLQLDLAASRLDAAQLHSSLLPTRLDGPLAAVIGAARQELKLDLKDSQFSLRAEASHAAGRIALPRLELAAGPARLAARGELSLAGNMAFTAEGRLERFDPARFAKLPAALINATLQARGQLAPRPVIDASFALQDSRLAGQPLSGSGKLNIDWPRIPQADIRLAAGPNTLTARGAFGRAGDKLAVAIAAPQLAPYGLEGGLDGQLDLAGTPQQPRLDGRLQSPRLGWPGLFRVSELSLVASAGRAADAPLRLDLAAAQLDTPGQPALARQLHIRAEGSNREQRWQAGARLFDQARLELAAAGGLISGQAGPAWRGRLLEARLEHDDKQRNIRLDAPADLQLGHSAWSFGPAQWRGEQLGWQATLQATAEANRLSAALSARGPRIGVVEGSLKAGLLGAWALNDAAPWQGSLRTEIADLAWLAELIGTGWQSEGRFHGELALAGTPARPLASGRFRGDKLGLRLIDQGLRLANGELAVDLDDNLLRVRQLAFDSVLQPAPRALRLAARDDVARLAGKPGRLEVSGEMRLDRDKGADSAWLDVRLDRLGVFQQADQWVLLSGDGRLSWQEATLGARGKLAVDAGYWQLAANDAPRLSDDVVIKRPGGDKAATKLRPKLDLDISTDFGRNFLFKGAGLSARLVGDLRLRASGRDLPRATGSIRTRDGRFDAYGQQLAIERGILTFQGLLDNPGLDVRAVRQGLAVEAGVQIGGTAQRPVVKLISDPELPDAEKLAWLVLGHGPEQMSAGDAAVLLSAAGGLLGNDSGNVVTQLKRTFGIDEFGIRQGDIGGTGSRQPTSRVAGSSFDTTAATGNQIFSVGKRLGANALLSYEQSLGKAESIVKLTVNLTRQVSVIGRAGSDNALDLFYTISFGRPARPPRAQ